MPIPPVTADALLSAMAQFDANLRGTPEWANRVRLRVDAAIGPALPRRATLMACHTVRRPALHALRYTPAIVTPTER